MEGFSSRRALPLEIEPGFTYDAGFKIARRQRRERSERREKS
jgi:hypothetical protein